MSLGSAYNHVGLIVESITLVWIIFEFRRAVYRRPSDGSQVTAKFLTGRKAVSVIDNKGKIYV